MMEEIGSPSSFLGKLALLDIYCTYLTVYLGNKLPPFYIGSGKIKKIERGYRGSVSSKEYSQIWKEELLKNPQLFKMHILETFADYDSAARKEAKLQLALNVVRNPLYINQCVFPHFSSISQHRKRGPSPLRGVPRSDETKRKISEAQRGKRNPNHKPMLGKAHSLETKKKISEAKLGRKNPNAGLKLGHVPWNKGKTGVYSEDTLRAISEARKGQKASPETKAKLSKSGKGRKISEEHKKKIGAAHRGLKKPRKPKS